MPEISFNLQQTSTPTGVPRQAPSFQGYQDLASGMLNLGQAMQRQQGASHALQNKLEQRQRVTNAYSLYSQYSQDYSQSLSQLKLTQADPLVRRKEANEITQQLQESYMQRAAEGGFGDEFLKHAVPYTITRQEKFLAENDSEIHDFELGRLQAEGTAAVRQTVDEGVGLLVDVGDHAVVEYNDDTHEVMGSHLQAYADLVEGAAGLSLPEKNKLLLDHAELLKMETGKRMVLADPETFLNIDPTKEVVFPVPLMDLDKGYRSFDTTYSQTQVNELRGLAWGELQKQHTKASHERTQAKELRSLNTDKVKAGVMQNLIDGLDPEVSFSLIDQNLHNLDYGEVAQLRKTLVDHYNSRAGSPHEPPNPNVQGIQDRIRLEGVVGEKAVTAEEIVTMADEQNWTKQERTDVWQVFNQAHAKAETTWQRQIKEQMSFARDRFSSIAGSNPMAALEIKQDSIDRLNTEMQQAMSIAFEAIPEEKRTLTAILEASYNAQVQAIDVVFAGAGEKIKPEHLVGLGRVINSQLPKSRPEGWSTKDWITHNVASGKLSREQAIPLLFMSQLYDINQPTDQQATLAAQKPVPKNFSETAIMMEQAKQGNDVLTNIDNELRLLQARQKAWQEKLDRELQELESMKKKGPK